MPNFAAWFAWRRRRIMARQGGGFDPNVFIRPAAAALIYTTYAPAITGIVGYAGAPASASLQYTTYQPTVSAPASVSPGAASLIYTAYQPTVSTGAAGTLAQQLVDDWASGGAGSDGFAMVFEDAGGTDAPSIYVKDSGTPANDTDINLTDDFDAFNSFLTYTSPSPKIVRQSDGNLKYCAHNLVLYSEQFDNAYWTKFGATISANATTDPLGGSTADKLIAGGTTGTHHCSRSLTVENNARYGLSIYAKAAEYDYIVITPPGDGACGAWFDLTNGTVGTEQANALAASIQSIGSGWYRCSVEAVTAATTDIVYIFVSNADNVVDYTGDGSSGIYIWGANVYKAPADTSYLPTTTAARFALPIQHDSSNNAEGLLVEPAATNLLPYSRPNIATGEWAGVVATATSNNVASPSGETTGTTITAQSGTNTHYIFDTFSAAASVLSYAHSIYAKAGTTNFLYFRVFGGAPGLDAHYVLNLSTGAVTQTLAAGDSTPTFEDVGNGWWRITLYDTSNGTSGTPTFYLGPHDGSASDTWTAAGTETVHVWHAQVETGSVATSPIITTGATATRAVDDILKPNASLPIGAGPHSAYIKATADVINVRQEVFAITDAAASDRVRLELNSSQPRAIVDYDPTGKMVDDQYTTTSISAGTAFKHAMSVNTNDFAHSVGGGAVETDTSVSVSNITDGEMQFGGGVVVGPIHPILIHEFMYLPEDISNADLESITT